MKRINVFYLMVLVLALFTLSVTGCLAGLFSLENQPESANTSTTKNIDGPICGSATKIRLLAGQTIDVGTVIVWNDEDNLYVKYVPTGGWVLKETHLAVTTSFSQIPQNKNGNPIPGKFPYKSQTGFFEIPLNWLVGSTIYLAAQAKVVNGTQTETAWGEGVDFPGKNWATYFSYTITDPTPPTASLTVIKALSGGETTNSWSFQLSGSDDYASNFTLTAGEEKIFDSLTPGEYTLTETFLPGFECVSISVDGISTPVTVNPGEGWTQFPLIEKANVTITFTNQAIPPWTGTWDMYGIYDTYIGKMWLTQNGNVVSGTFKDAYNGVISGTTEGYILSGSYSQDSPVGKTGIFEFTLALDGQSFTGWYIRDDETFKRKWSGIKVQD